LLGGRGKKEGTQSERRKPRARGKEERTCKEKEHEEEETVVKTVIVGIEK
jgi:hypothetical protein